MILPADEVERSVPWAPQSKRDRQPIRGCKVLRNLRDLGRCLEARLRRSRSDPALEVKRRRLAG